MKTSMWKKAFLLFLFLCLTSGSSEAAPRESVRNRRADDWGWSRLSSFEFHQSGDSDLVISISGKDLPLPDVAHFDNNKTRIVLQDVQGERVSPEHKENAAPLVVHVSKGQVDRDYVITITTERPLQLRTVRGVAPADSYTLRLTTTQQQQKIIEEPMKTQQPQTLRVPTGPFAVNTPITLDLRDADLRDVFRMLAMQLKRNIIIDNSIPNVSVTMTVKNEPLSKVYDYLMKAYDLEYEFMGDTIIVGTREGLARISGKRETRAYRIAYAEPGAVSRLLPNLTRIRSDALVVDERLRTVYATSTPEILEEVAIAIQNLDNPGKQIMLQARILEFTDDASFEVEQALNGVYNHWWFQYSGQDGVLGGYVDDNRRGRPAGITRPGPGATLPDILTPMQGIWREFDASFRALETRGKGKTLANPSVITIDGVEASIKLTQDYPYVSGRDRETYAALWTTQEVGPQLKMIPKVGRDGIVTIELNIETGEVLEMMVSSTGEQMPRTSTRTLTTTVRVRDGEPFVVGGLYSESTTNRRIRVPVLGSIPIVGEMFTFRFRDNKKTQVVIVVIPHILSTPDVAIEQERVMRRQ